MYLRNSNPTRAYRLPIFRVPLPHTDPMPYIFTYTDFTTYTAYKDYRSFSNWKLSTVTGVTPTHSCGKISEWDQTLIEYTYFLVIMTPMIRSLDFLNIFPWSDLVIKSLVITSVGHHSTVTSFMGIRSVTRKNRMFM